VLAPQQPPLLGLVGVVAPSVAGGNTAVVVTSKTRRGGRACRGDDNDLDGASAGRVMELGRLARRHHQARRPHAGPRAGLELGPDVLGRERRHRSRRLRRDVLVLDPGTAQDPQLGRASP
jgi:hypothetical protein